ncbi:MAG: hypothetical protein ACRCW2_02380 [Cellulosilyticaceae bacterium]
MLRYFSFLVKCLTGKIPFFKSSLAEQARLLQKHRLYFLAAKYYTGLERFDKAAYCFAKCNAHKDLMYTYMKLELPSKALEIATAYHYYEDGARFCEQIGNPIKAAYFYSFFNPLKGAKIYRKHGLVFEAGTCFLLAQQFNLALECFNACDDPVKKYEGRHQIEEVAITLYFKKHYERATKLFIKLEDYESAIVCSQHLRHSTLTQQLSTYITH